MRGVLLIGTVVGTGIGTLWVTWFFAHLAVTTWRERSDG